MIKLVRFHPVILISLISFVVIDVCMDYLEGVDFIHIFVELCISVVFVGICWLIGIRSQKLVLRNGNLQEHLEKINLENDGYLREIKDLKNGLGVLIDKQFDEWLLTNSEREVALFLLKGFSIKEVADLRSTSEGTTRQQSVRVYEKSGLKGRAELSAFFLEDILNVQPISKPG